MSDQTHRAHGYGHDDSGQRIPVSEFPHGEIWNRIDGVDESAPFDDREKIALATREMIRFVMSISNAPGTRGRYSRAVHGGGLRAIVLAYVLRYPEVSEIRSLNQLSRVTGKNISTIWKIASELSRRFHIPLAVANQNEGRPKTK